MTPITRKLVRETKCAFRGDPIVIELHATPYLSARREAARAFQSRTPTSTTLPRCARRSAEPDSRASPASRVRRNPKEPPHPLAPGLHSSGAGVFAASPKPITDSFNSRKRKFTMSAKTHEFETTDIPLKKLLAWNENVRITSSDQGIDELADSIASI